MVQLSSANCPSEIKELFSPFRTYACLPIVDNSGMFNSPDVVDFNVSLFGRTTSILSFRWVFCSSVACSGVRYVLVAPESPLAIGLFCNNGGMLGFKLLTRLQNCVFCWTTDEVEVGEVKLLFTFNLSLFIRPYIQVQYAVEPPILFANVAASLCPSFLELQF